MNNRQLRDVITDAWSAVHAANQIDSPHSTGKPSLFLRGGALVRIAEADDGPTIDVLNETSMYGVLARTANWNRTLGTTSWSPHLHPKMPRVTCCENPGSGTSSAGIADSYPGFREGRPPHFRLPAITHRTALAISRRVARRCQMFPPIPHRSRSRPHGLCCWMTCSSTSRLSPPPIARMRWPQSPAFLHRMIDGPTPIHLIEAPTMGSGKGLLTSLISIVTHR